MKSWWQYAAVILSVNLGVLLLGGITAECLFFPATIVAHLMGKGWHSPEPTFTAFKLAQAFAITGILATFLWKRANRNARLQAIDRFCFGFIIGCFLFCLPNAREYRHKIDRPDSVYVAPQTVARFGVPFLMWEENPVQNSVRDPDEAAPVGTYNRKGVMLNLLTGLVFAIVVGFVSCKSCFRRKPDHLAKN